MMLLEEKLSLLLYIQAVILLGECDQVSWLVIQLGKVGWGEKKEEVEEAKKGCKYDYVLNELLIV